MIISKLEVKYEKKCYCNIINNPHVFDVYYNQL